MENQPSSIENAQKIKCKKCGNINNITNNHCIHCGAVLNESIPNQQGTIKCPNCGMENNSNNKHCTNCGTNMITGEQNNNPNISPSDNSKKANKVDPAYVGLGIILGILSLAIMIYMRNLSIVFIIIAIGTLFNKNTRYYGYTVLIGILVLAITFFALFILLIGMCAGIV